jgi:hypothetical protein
LKAWGNRENRKIEYSETADIPSSSNRLDSAGITYNLSKRLLSLAKMKDIVNIEAGFVMMALALAICSEVCEICLFLSTASIGNECLKNDGVFPELPNDVIRVLRRWVFSICIDQIISYYQEFG